MLDVSSGGWRPVISLFSYVVGSVTSITGVAGSLLIQGGSAPLFFQIMACLGIYCMAVGYSVNRDAPILNCFIPLPVAGDYADSLDDDELSAFGPWTSTLRAWCSNPWFILLINIAFGAICLPLLLWAFCLPVVGVALVGFVCLVAQETWKGQEIANRHNKALREGSGDSKALQESKGSTCSVIPVGGYPHIGRAIVNRAGLQVLFDDCYGDYAPKANRENYLKYFTSDCYYADCKKTRVFYPSQDDNLARVSSLDSLFRISRGEAHEILSQRHLVQIGGQPCFDQKKTEELLGDAAYSYFLQKNKDYAGKTPTMLGVFTQAPIFSCGRECVKECGQSPTDNPMVDIFSVSVPALNLPKSPYFDYFVQDNHVNIARYSQYLRGVFQLSFKAFLESSQATEFVLPTCDFEAFLPEEQKKAAIQAFYQVLISEVQLCRSELNKASETRGKLTLRLSSSISIVGRRGISNVLQGLDDLDFLGVDTYQGDIGDFLAHRSDTRTPFVVNPWDFISRVGNGNDKDSSVNGALGRCTPVALLATPVHNLFMDMVEESTVYRSVSLF